MVLFNVLGVPILYPIFTMAPDVQERGCPGEVTFTAMNGGFSVRFPARWIFYESPPNRVQATIENPQLSRIIIKYTSLEDPLPNTKLIIKPDLSPSALADAVTEDLRTDETTVGLTVLESGPAIIDGNPAYKVVSRFRNRELGDAEVIKVCYSTIHKSRLYIIMFDARVGQYYDQSFPAFEEAVKTFQFGKR